MRVYMAYASQVYVFESVVIYAEEADEIQFILGCAGSQYSMFIIPTRQLACVSLSKDRTCICTFI